MLKCPATPHRLHKFRHKDRLYLADLNLFRLVEVNQIAWDAVELAPTLETPRLIDRLSKIYPKPSVIETLEALGDLQNNDHIFSSDSQQHAPTEIRDRLKIYVPQSKEEWFKDPESLCAGTNIALYQTMQSLSKFADVYISGESEEEIIPSVYAIKLSREELQASPRRFNQSLNALKVNGILAYQTYASYDLLPLLRSVNVPIVIQSHCPRGHAGQAINTTLLHHALMRPFDAFTAPSESVAKFYAKFVGDTHHFHSNPNGVDAQTFRPMDKSEAKAQLAELMQDNRIQEQFTVGFLSRFQPEKGGHVFVQLAEMHPDLLFLVGGSYLLRPSTQQLPDNLIYVGFLPRKQLPMLYNAFDIYCFPTMAGEETFGLTLLEAMACGVPPVVPRFDGLPEVVGEAGVIVDAEELAEDMAGFAATVSAESLSKGVQVLLEDDFRLEIGQKARTRALTLTWDNNAKRLVQLFQELNQIKYKQRNTPDLLVSFVNHYDAFQNQLESQALLLNLTPFLEAPLQKKSGYVQTMEEGLALTLLKRHTPKQVEAVLAHVLDDESNAPKIVERALNFLNVLA